jgi:hypothetical protein
MSYGTIIGQGSFTQPNPAINQVIQVPSNLDWLRVWNYTQADQGTAAAGPNAFMSYWQRGMPAGTGIYLASGAAGAVTTNITVDNAFQLYDPSGQSAGALPLFGPAIATTASTNVTRPVVSTANTAGLVVGSIVRMSNTAQTDVNGIDMVVGAINPGVSFTLLTATNALATAPGAIGGAGFYRQVNYNPLFYPRRLYITNITQAANGQVSTSIAHGLTPGQAIRFSIPTVSGMTQLNPTADNNYLYGIIETVVDDYNFTININTTAFTAFTYPTIAQQPSSFPIVEPIGEDTATSLSSATIQVPTIGGIQIYNTNSGILADSTVNTGYLGMILAAGALLPAGVAGDVCYWVAGKSEFGGL